MSASEHDQPRTDAPEAGSSPAAARAAARAEARRIAQLRRAPKAAAQRHHVIIGGTGRAGTTLLVRVLTRLGLPTGYDANDIVVDDVSKAGLEFDPLRNRRAPYIVKSPNIGRSVEQLVARQDIALDHAIICIRRLEDAAESRRRVLEENKKAGRGHGPGGILPKTKAARQEQVLSLLFHKLLDHLTEHEVPLVFLHFPKFANDAAYLHRQLKVPFPQLEEDAVRAALEAEVRPDWIHTFTPAAPPRRRSTA
jgi:hypothetical protein